MVLGSSHTKLQEGTGLVYLPTDIPIQLLNPFPIPSMWDIRFFCLATWKCVLFLMVDCSSSYICRSPTRYDWRILEDYGSSDPLISPLKLEILAETICLAVKLMAETSKNCDDGQRESLKKTKHLDNSFSKLAVVMKHQHFLLKNMCKSNWIMSFSLSLGEVNINN